VSSACLLQEGDVAEEGTLVDIPSLGGSNKRVPDASMAVIDTLDTKNLPLSSPGKLAEKETMLDTQLPHQGRKRLLCGKSQEVPDVSLTLADKLDNKRLPLSFLDEKRSAVMLISNAVAKAWRAFVKDLMTATALQAGLIGGTADLLVQVAINGATFASFDLRRCLSFVLFGTCYCGGFQPSVYRLSDRLFGDRVHWKLIAEFCAYGPLVYTPSFYMITGMLQGMGWSGSLENLSCKYLSTQSAYVKLWLLPMAVYFRWVPKKYRVLFLASFGFLEKCIYSYLANINC